MTKYTVEQRVARARMALLSHNTWCLYSGLLMLGKLIIDKDMPTAATNGRDVIIGEAFAESLTDEELRFLLLHENEHKALRQMSTYKFLWNENARLCNVAMDFVVNIRLLDADDGEKFIAMPKQGCYDIKYRGWSTKQVYDDLKQKQKQGKGSEAGGLDVHDFEGAEALSAEEQEQLSRDIESSMRQGAILAGKKGSPNASRLFDGLGASQIRWQEILAEFIKSVTKGRDNSSWSKLNRRWVSSGLYLPSSISETVGRLGIGIDASGSTWSGKQLEGFITELVAICKDCIPEAVDVLWWDTKVASVQEFKPEQYDTLAQELHIQGGGGTTPSCVTDWIKKENRNYEAFIMLSDGCVGSDWGDWTGAAALPLLWVLNTKQITAPCGQTLYCEGGY